MSPQLPPEWGKVIGIGDTIWTVTPRGEEWLRQMRQSNDFFEAGNEGYTLAQVRALAHCIEGSADRIKEERR